MTSSDENVIALELTDEVKEQQIVTSYVFDTEIDNQSIELNHKYSNKKITSPIESNWPKTMAIFIKELKRKKVDPDRITVLSSDCIK